MVFTYPAFFIALGALAIPIIIHLFNLRKYKKVQFTNVHLLQEIQFETKAKSRLKHWLILLSRILAVIMLVSAFSMPFLPIADSQTPGLLLDEVVSVYLDNSFSMSAKDDKDMLLEEAKNKARSIAAALDNSTRFQLITNDFLAAHQHLYKKEAFLNLLNEVTITPNFREISSVINRQKDLLKENNDARKTIFILSDFQKSTFDHDAVVNDSSINFNLISVKSVDPGNLFIDSCWFSSPIRQYGEQEILNVRIINRSEKNYNSIPLKLYINGNQKTPGTVNIEPNTTQVVQLSYTNREYGNQACEVQIRDYPVTFDDRFFLNYHIDSTIRVLAINGNQESQALYALFKSAEGIRLENQPETGIDFGSFSHFELIILNEVKSPTSGLAQELKKFMESSGHLVIFPPPEIDDVLYNDFLATLELPSAGKIDTNKADVTTLNNESVIYANVFSEIPKNLNLPVIHQHYPFNKRQLTVSEKLLTLGNGEAFLEKFSIGKGAVYVFSSPLDSKYNNFSKHSIFVPTIYNIALNSQAAQTLFHTIGKNTMLTISNPENTETVYHLKAEQIDIIPEVKIRDDAHQLFFHNQVNKDGNFLLQSNSQNEPLGVAFNYDRNESYLENYTDNELNDIIQSEGWNNFRLIEEQSSKNLASLVSFINHGKPLWKYCIILALIFLGIEVSLTKLWK